jgi:hypothetical protein
MVQIGDAVKVVDEVGVEHAGLVTAVHGQQTETYVPSINAVFCSSDETKRDPYGRQVERFSSLSHRSNVGPTPGRYWE